MEYLVSRHSGPTTAHGVGTLTEMCVSQSVQRFYLFKAVIDCGWMDILSRAREVGSPTNHLGSRQRRDTDQGSSSPLTGGRHGLT